MKKTEIQKLKHADKNELLKEVGKAKEELRSLRFDLASGKIKNVGGIREIKKKIARMLTFANQTSGEVKAGK